MQGNKRNEEKRARLVHLIILAALQSAMAAELVFLVAEQQWVHVFLVTGIMLTMALPVVLKSRFPVQIPSEIQILAILFGFATLFLGEVRDYYERFWWWDLALHATAGLLLGLQRPFENVLKVLAWRDSSSGCGPERAVAEWLNLRSDRSATRPI